MLLFLLPLLVPPITYGIPLATVLYQAGIWPARLRASLLANLVPTVPFVILVMIPFVEQIDPRIEAAARVFGAGTWRLFVHVLVPLLTAGRPGGAAAGAGAHHRHVRTDLPDRRARPARRWWWRSTTRCSPPACGPVQSIDAMAVVYMVTTLVWLLIALRFVNPTQIVTRAKQANR